MNNLVDSILSKVERIANQPSPLMTLVDAFLSRVALKESAAAYPCWIENKYDRCLWQPNCPNSPYMQKQRWSRQCCCHSQACGAWGCGPWYSNGAVCC